ncbi:putative leucine-rich repeat-containing protein DDB_G0290503 [Battus philenor]|uniref:putative leucine-rich repeat-containing protein DDB_G0290503 n=1 Tax=Battus philenor TaxID=42288 RepID=UPI0035CECB77
MAESNELQALEKICTEVDESQIKIIFSSQCIKAQAFLVNKLKNQTKQEKAICKIISGENVKLEAEIKFAEQEINNLIIASNTIKSGNIELRKELLLKKEENLEILKKIELGEKKYEELWMECKSRYENVPFIKKCLQDKQKIQLIENNISHLHNETADLLKEIKIKKIAVMGMDQKRVIDLAKFLINDRPKIIKMINGLINEIQELSNKITTLEQKSLKRPLSQLITKEITNEGPNILVEKATRDEKEVQKINKDCIMMPKLQLLDIDVDILNVQIDQIKNDDLIIQSNKVTVIDVNKNRLQLYECNEERNLTYFNNMAEPFKEKNKNYSQRKLINILDDVKLNNNQSIDIISKVRSDQLRKVNSISPEVNNDINFVSDNKDNNLFQEERDKVDYTVEERKILVPPTQFLDENKNSQEKKKVTFKESMQIATNEHEEAENNQSNNVTFEDGMTSETLNIQDISLVSNEDYNKIKDKVLKERNLDLSPQFMYAKHSILPKVPENEVVRTSKFFDSENKENLVTAVITEERFNCDIDNNDENKKEEPDQTQRKLEKDSQIIDSSSLNEKKTSNSKNIQSMRKIHHAPITGYLFNHGSQGISESLNLSDSTLGLEDGDFPHCIDSSLLLSPKADTHPELASDKQNRPEEVPNFMSGIRKTASLFGWSPIGGNPSTSSQNCNENFKFNFKNEEKKNRGGLFSMFHK